MLIEHFKLKTISNFVQRQQKRKILCKQKLFSLAFKGYTCTSFLLKALNSI